MPRKPRVKSDSGMYHVMMRGINRQTIFEDDEDCEKFLSLLTYYRGREGRGVPTDDRERHHDQPGGPSHRMDAHGDPEGAGRIVILVQ